MSFKDVQALVVDVSAGLCKAGFADDDDAPRAVFSSAVTQTRHSSVMYGANHKVQPTEDTSSSSNEGVAPGSTRQLSTKYPDGEHGIVTSWDDMEKIWHRTFYKELLVAPAEHPVLLTEVALNPKFNQERMTLSMFETFNALAMYAQMQQVMVLYASGRTAGCVVDSGDAVSFTVPVHEGYAVHDAIGRLDIGGRDLSGHLARMLCSERHSGGGHSLKDMPIGREIARDIREKLTYVALDFDQELRAASQDPSRFEESYELPDGNFIVVGNEQFRTPEAFFRPWLLGKETGQGLHVCAFQSIRKSAADIQSDLYSNSLLSGANTKCPGFGEGADSIGTFRHKNQGRHSTREQVRSVDWRFDPGVALVVPGDVDLSGRVRRDRSTNRSSQAPLTLQLSSKWSCK